MLILAEIGRQVGNDDVGLFEQLDAVRAAEIAAAVPLVRRQRFAGGFVLLEEEFDILDVARAKGAVEGSGGGR